MNKSNRRNPYRLIVWAPGGVGSACLRELVKRKDCRIVGVLAYSESKKGKDIGELIDHAPIGIQITTEKESVFSMDADVVLWCGTMPFDEEGMLRDVIRLLESGKHVISSAVFHYAHSHGAAYAERLDAACKKGKTCLFGTGENPGFWFERLGLTLTGVCSHVEHLQVHEYVDVSSGTSTPDVLKGVGFGETVEQATASGVLASIWKEYYFVEYLNMSSNALFDRPMDRVEHTPTYHVADRDVVLAKSTGASLDMTIQKGLVRAMTHSFTGFLDGTPRLTTSVNWYLRAENSPFAVRSADCWLIELEGRPVSLRCEIAAFASLHGDLAFYPGDPTSSTWYATAVTMIQGIPIVCSHKPGIVYPSIFATCTSDLRILEGRTSIVS